MNLLESLKRSTTVVADTGDIEAIAEHKPQDATTNPSLLLQAAQKPQYEGLVADALDFTCRGGENRAACSEAFMDKLFVDVGCETLKIIPGRVSTEIDAGLSLLVEKSFRWMHNEDAMATEKLAEGIRKFYADARKLQQYALTRVTQKMAN